jgi:hypothetical protein
MKMISRFAVLVVAAVVLATMALQPEAASAQQVWRTVPGYENMNSALDAQGNVIQRRAIPRATDGKPDFTGVWAGPGFLHRVGRNDTDTPRVTPIDAKTFPPFQPGGETFMMRPHSGDLLIDDPTALCLPNGIPRQLYSPYAQQWIYTPKQLIILYEYMHFFRVIPIGAPNRPHDPNVEPTWMGDTIAWWEGDTLVLDTRHLKEWMWDASHDPSRWHSDQLHVQERITYTDPMTASYEMRYDDPKIFTAAFTAKHGMKLHPTWSVLEFVCEENNRCRAGECRLAPEQEQQQSGR